MAWLFTSSSRPRGLKGSSIGTAQGAEGRAFAAQPAPTRQATIRTVRASPQARPRLVPGSPAAGTGGAFGIKPASAHSAQQACHNQDSQHQPPRVPSTAFQYQKPLKLHK